MTAPYRKKLIRKIKDEARRLLRAQRERDDEDDLDGFC